MTAHDWLTLAFGVFVTMALLAIPDLLTGSFFKGKKIAFKMTDKEQRPFLGTPKTEWAPEMIERFLFESGKSLHILYDREQSLRVALHEIQDYSNAEDAGKIAYIDIALTTFMSELNSSYRKFKREVEKYS